MLLWCWGPASAAQPSELPLPNAADYVAETNAWLERRNAEDAACRLRNQRIALGVSVGLTLGFGIFVWHTWRLHRPRAFRISRLLLWTPCFLLGGAWFFPPLLLVATGLVPFALGVWWKRALSWWELGLGTALGLVPLTVLWLVFRVLASMASQGAGR